MYFMNVNATFAVDACTRMVSRRPCTCPTTCNILILHKPLQRVKSRIGPFCPPNPRKSIVYTGPSVTDSHREGGRDGEGKNKISKQCQSIIQWHSHRSVLPAGLTFGICNNW